MGGCGDMDERKVEVVAGEDDGCEGVDERV